MWVFILWCAMTLIENYQLHVQIMDCVVYYLETYPELFCLSLFLFVSLICLCYFLDTSGCFQKPEIFVLEDFRPMDSYDVLNGNSVPDFQWTISGINAIVNRARDEDSEEFQWKSPDLRCRAKLKINAESRASVCLNLTNNRPSAQAAIHPIPTVYYVLRDRRGQSQVKHLVRSSYYLFTSTFTNDIDYERELCHKDVLLQRYYWNIKENTVLVEMFVEPPWMVRVAQSTDGHLVWPVDNYRMRRQAEENRWVFIQESPYFYTSPRGYRVRVRVALTGCGRMDKKGQCEDVLCVFICSEAGLFDEELPWSFPHRTTVTLGDTRNANLRCRQSVERDIEEDAEYCVHFEKIDPMSYVHKDSLSIDVVIVPKPSKKLK